MLSGYFVQYKFILPESVKHSSYSYQKLFRAIYGYTQNVTKSTGKTHKYFRRGILSNTPHIRPGKNCVIIPPGQFNLLLDFFKTGKNPSHHWQQKGDWKAVYYMNEKNLSEDEVIAAFHDLLDRMHVSSSTNVQSNVEAEINQLATQPPTHPDPTYRKLLVQEAQATTSSAWFQEVYRKSPRLSTFYQNFLKLK